MLIIDEILKALWLLSLFGVANMAPVFCKKIAFLETPVDFGKFFKGKRVFGNHKTWRGLIVAPLFAILYFVLQRYFYSNFDFIKAISFFNYETMSFWFPFFVGFGVIFGDLVKSFFKRQCGIAPVRSWVPFDQIDYLLGGLIFGSLFFIPGFFSIVLILIFGIFLHILFNLFGYLLKLTSKPI